MKLVMINIVATLALGIVSMSAQAVSVSSMTIQEIGTAWTGGTAHIGNNVGTGAAAGFSGGAFYLIGGSSPLPNGTAGNFVSGFGGNIVNGTTQTTFGSSFNFSVSEFFTPNSCGISLYCSTSPSMAATVDGPDSLIIDLSQFGAHYTPGGGNQFKSNPTVYGPANAALNLEVHNSTLGFGGLAANQFYYSLDWAHTFTSTDNSYGYVGYNNFIADWHIEGIATTVPEASTYSMLLAGLGLVGGMVSRRRKMA